jgi:hypothetical protein
MKQIISVLLLTLFLNPSFGALGQKIKILFLGIQTDVGQTWVKELDNSFWNYLILNDRLRIVSRDTVKMLRKRELFSQNTFPAIQDLDTGKTGKSYGSSQTLHGCIAFWLFGKSIPFTFCRF